MIRGIRLAALLGNIGMDEVTNIAEDTPNVEAQDQSKQNLPNRTGSLRGRIDPVRRRMLLEWTGLFERRFHLYSVRQTDVQPRLVVAGGKLLIDRVRK